MGEWSDFVRVRGGVLCGGFEGGGRRFRSGGRGRFRSRLSSVGVRFWGSRKSSFREGGLGA